MFPFLSKNKLPQLHSLVSSRPGFVCRWHPYSCSPTYSLFGTICNLRDAFLPMLLVQVNWPTPFKSGRDRSCIKMCYQRPAAGFVGSGMLLYIFVVEKSVPKTAWFCCRTITNIMATHLVSSMNSIDFRTCGIRSHDILMMSFSVDALIIMALW